MDFNLIVFFGMAIFILLFMVGWIFRKRDVYTVSGKFPEEWRELLETNVHFYQNLDKAGKKKFEKKVLSFYKQVRITGIKVEVDDLDRLLTASSAVIPLFAFDGWRFTHLTEVLLYPDYFDKNFSTDSPEEVISGMVGTGRNMDGVMILNKTSLHNGFRNPDDKKNVGIHEMAHIIDKEDGAIDGVPGVLNDTKYASPWLKLMHKEMRKIKEGKSEIDEYAATSEEEFLAVTTEYFFEKPQQLKDKHPKLYKYLRKVYGQDMVRRLTEPFKTRKRIGRNDPCPCGSGEKYKKCCLN